MDVIEVDPKLFVTCRLCLEDLGQYQIVPSVQQQIKYCFDIEVEPFDGLPQLICMKCKAVLTNFYTVKNTFRDKQTNLLNKVLKKDVLNSLQPQQDTVSSSQQASENSLIPAKKKQKRKRVLQSSSSSDSESSKHSHVDESKKKKSSKQLAWELDYKKQVVCNLCSSIWPNTRSIWSHLRAHEPLKERYKNIFKRHCSVSVTKVDEKLNKTGVNYTVVHSPNKIIVPGKNSFFYTIYLREETNTNCSDENKINDSNKIKNVYEVDTLSGGCTDDDEEIVLKKTRRKRRLLSRSSNETVVIESNSNKMLSDGEEDSKVLTNIEVPVHSDQCINIDSSDSESDKGNNESGQSIKLPMEAKIGDYKVIQGIMSMCVNTYRKKPVSVSGYTNRNSSFFGLTVGLTESQLNNKVLSIGRKTITRQGFKCTGLLRYMEHKSLEILWVAITQILCGSNKENYIRILTKVRPENKDDNIGWVNIATHVKHFTKASNDLQHNIMTVATITTGMLANSNTSLCLQEMTGNLNQLNTSSKLDTTQAVLYVDSKANNSDVKKLLNANPVANPKQLPKKLGSVNSTKDVNNYCLPIITSTTSLASITDGEENKGDAPNNVACTGVTGNPEQPAPRIKVKPVSELMSERTLNMIEQSNSSTNSNMLVSQIENVWPHQHPINVFVPNITPQIHLVSPPLQVVQLPTTTLNVSSGFSVMPTPEPSNAKEEYVILDTTEFPNTRTESPFKYLKNLLQVHNLILLDPCDILSEEFITLIKFKVLFKQEHKVQEPVMLCLSLFCLKNTFCFKIKYRNRQNLDIKNISANWQWEILQLYRGEVITKVLQNAQKCSREIYDYTNKFLCLLKSINRRKF